MTHAPADNPPPPRPTRPADRNGGATRWRPAPLLRAPESSRTIFAVTIVAAMAPLTAGVVFFGYHAAIVAALSIGGCLTLERLFFRVTRSPAMQQRSHAALTGVLLALTLPPFAPWYVPLLAAAFAVIVGKGVFGGVGHFLWAPALVGRLAVGVMFAATLNPAAWPLLSHTQVVTGDATNCRTPEFYTGWRNPVTMPTQADGYLLTRPATTLAGLANHVDPRYETIRDGLLDLPAIRDTVVGSTPGSIGETSAVMLLLAGLYLVYRHYVRWFLPASIVASAAAVAAIAPAYLSAPTGAIREVWLPLTAEGLEIGVTYIGFHVFTGELLLAAIFLASEMTSRPVTPAGQVLFGIGCGALGMLGRLYIGLPMPFYVAVLIMSTFTPLLERFTRPRVMGRRPWWLRAMRRQG